MLLLEVEEDDDDDDDDDDDVELLAFAVRYIRTLVRNISFLLLLLLYNVN